MGAPTSTVSPDTSFHHTPVDVNRQASLEEGGRFAVTVRPGRLFPGGGAGASADPRGAHPALAAVAAVVATQTMYKARLTRQQ